MGLCNISGAEDDAWNSCLRQYRGIAKIMHPFGRSLAEGLKESRHEWNAYICLQRRAGREFPVTHDGSQSFVPQQSRYLPADARLRLSRQRAAIYADNTSVGDDICLRAPVNGPHAHGCRAKQGMTLFLKLRRIVALQRLHHPGHFMDRVDP